MDLIDCTPDFDAPPEDVKINPLAVEITLMWAVNIIEFVPTCSVDCLLFIANDTRELRLV